MVLPQFVSVSRPSSFFHYPSLRASDPLLSRLASPRLASPSRPRETQRVHTHVVDSAAREARRHHWSRVPVGEQTNLESASGTLAGASLKRRSARNSILPLTGIARPHCRIKCASDVERAQYAGVSRTSGLWRGWAAAASGSDLARK